MQQEKERYLIVFNFGSFIYMFFIIGMSAGLVFGIATGIFALVREPSFSTLGYIALGFVQGTFSIGLTTAFIGALGFLPYRWLCTRGWGWPTKGIFIKKPESVESTL